MPSDSLAAKGASRLLYPELPHPLTPADLHRLFTPSYQERKWAPTVGRTPLSQLALLVQLKMFQTIGRFRRAEDIPARIYEHIAARLGVDHGPTLLYPDRTLYRHRPAVLKYLGVAAWGARARGLAQSTMSRVATARTDPAELINAAIDALIRNHFELPALDTLRRLAATAHRTVNAAQWGQVYGQLSEKQRSALESLLIVEASLQHSAFAQLCQAPGRASRKNLEALMGRYQWLRQLPDPTPALQSVADAKVLQWANEARRLKAPELREYIAPRRQTLLLALIRQARGEVLDGLTQMLLKLVRKIECKSEQRLEQWYVDRRNQTDSLIHTFRESLIIHASAEDPAQKLARLDELFVAHGGREVLERACTEHLRHERQNWRPLARAVFAPLRSALLRLAELLPLQGTAASSDLLALIGAAADTEPPYFDYYRIEDIAADVLPREWRPLVHDHPEDPLKFNRRQLEVVAMLELAAAIKAGEIFVSGSLSYDRFWDRLGAADPSAISAYAASQGWGESAEEFVRSLKGALAQQAGHLEQGLEMARADFYDAAKMVGQSWRRLARCPHPPRRWSWRSS